MRAIKIFSVLLFLLFGTTVSAQETAFTGNPDTSFFSARDLAFSGQRTQARDTLKRVLAKYPDYADVRNLLASTYSWDGEYNKARGHFNKITSVEKENKEVWVAAIKNELYAEEYYLAMGLSNKALMYLPNDRDITALLQQATNNNSEKGRLKKDSKREKVKDSIETKNPKNELRMTNAFELFDVVYDPTISTSIQYKRETKAGSLIPRVNYANRFNTHGTQFEMDFYPKFSKLFYAYLNYGYSSSAIFPNHRVGAELYTNWPKKMELSGGIRYLDFADNKVNIYTGSVGLYRGNYYFTLRPYITPTDTKTGVSGTFLARRYLKDGGNYLGASLGIGFAPELKQLSSEDTVLAETLLFIESQQLLLEYQFTGKKNPNIYRANMGVTRQELVFDSGNFFWAVSAGFTYGTKF